MEYIIIKKFLDDIYSMIFIFRCLVEFCQKLHEK